MAAEPRSSARALNFLAPEQSSLRLSFYANRSFMLELLPSCMGSLFSYPAARLVVGFGDE